MKAFIPLQFVLILGLTTGCDELLSGATGEVAPPFGSDEFSLGGSPSNDELASASGLNEDGSMYKAEFVVQGRTHTIHGDSFLQDCEVDTGRDMRIWIRNGGQQFKLEIEDIGSESGTFYIHGDGDFDDEITLYESYSDSWYNRDAGLGRATDSYCSVNITQSGTRISGDFSCTNLYDLLSDDAAGATGSFECQP